MGMDFLWGSDKTVLEVGSSDEQLCEYTQFHRSARFKKK